MKAVTRSEHKRKELIICVLQHIRNHNHMRNLQNVRHGTNVAGAETATCAAVQCGENVSFVRVILTLPN